MRPPRKKIADLRRHATRPLVIRRERKVRQYHNILKIERGVRRPPLRSRLLNRFEMRRQPTRVSETKLFLPRQKSTSRSSRIPIIAGALLIVIALNFVGILGSGRSTVERVLTTAFSGLSYLTQARESFAAGDFGKSADSFTAAVTALQSAERDLLTLGGAGVVLSSQTDSVQAGSRLVTAGKLLASAGARFATSAQTVSAAAATWHARQQTVELGQPVDSFTDQLADPLRGIIAGLTELEDAATVLSLVDPDDLPTELRERVRNAKSQLALFLQTVRPLTENTKNVLELLGDRVPRRYLILFQNPDEIRPTGGFIGSVGILTLNDGFITDFQIRNVYEIDGQLARRQQPPEGFGFITNNWGLRDANYHPDFPTSAEAAARLFEEAGQGSVDGVLAITSNVLTRLVEATDGITLPRFGEKIQPAELNQLLSLVIETKMDGAAAPKQILGEVWDALRPQLAELSPTQLFEIALSAAAARDIQFWSNIPELAELATTLKLENSLTETAGDYLFVVNTSLSGNKSDRYTTNEITHETVLSVNGTAVNTLTITRRHNWNAESEAALDLLAARFGIDLTDDLKEILGRGRNVDLIKVFVPLGSEIISVTGIPMDRVTTQESVGKTYFSFALTVQPGAEREVQLVYHIPQKFSETYSLLAQQQAGDRVAEIQKTVRQSGQPIFVGSVPLNQLHEWQLGE